MNPQRPNPYSGGYNRLPSDQKVTAGQQPAAPAGARSQARRATTCTARALSVPRVLATHLWSVIRAPLLVLGLARAPVAAVTVRRSFARHPDAIVVHILGFLDQHGLRAVARTSRKLAQLAGLPKLDTDQVAKYRAVLRRLPPAGASNAGRRVEIRAGAAARLAFVEAHEARLQERVQPLRSPWAMWADPESAAAQLSRIDAWLAAGAESRIDHVFSPDVFLGLEDLHEGLLLEAAGYADGSPAGLQELGRLLRCAAWAGIAVEAGRMTEEEFVTFREAYSAVVASSALTRRHDVPAQDELDAVRELSGFGFDANADLEQVRTWITQLNRAGDRLPDMDFALMGIMIGRLPAGATRDRLATSAHAAVEAGARGDAGAIRRLRHVLVELKPLVADTLSWTASQTHADRLRDARECCRAWIDDAFSGQPGPFGETEQKVLDSIVGVLPPDLLARFKAASGGSTAAMSLPARRDLLLLLRDLLQENENRLRPAEHKRD